MPDFDSDSHAYSDTDSEGSNIEELWEKIKTIRNKIKKLEQKRYEELLEHNIEENLNVFTTPYVLSNSLCDFLGIAHDSKMSRADATRQIVSYSKRNSLQNKHEIKPDARLTSLLSLKEGDKLTYHNMQRHLSPHFIARVTINPVNNS